MLSLQDSIQSHGYTVARVQRVDVGLTQSGYETDKYRVVFYGRLDEIQKLTHDHPETIPYLPPNISIFAEGDQTLLVTLNPAMYKELFPHPALTELFERWESEVRAIFEEVRIAQAP